MQSDPSEAHSGYGGGDFDVAYIACGCTNENGCCDSDGRCVKYEGGKWICNCSQESDEEEEDFEKAMLRGEVVFKEE